MAVGKLEDCVLNGLKERLLEPDLIAEFAREYQREFNKRQRDAVRQNAATTNELKAVDARIGRIVDAIEAGADAAKLRERLAELERKRLQLKRDLESAGGEDAVIRIRPDLSGLYKRKVAELRENPQRRCRDAPTGDKHPEIAHRQNCPTSGNQARGTGNRDARPARVDHKSRPTSGAGRRCYANDGSGGGT